MATTGLDDAVETGKLTLDRVINACVLTPIPGESPVGGDPRYLELWSDLKRTRPSQDNLGAPEPIDSMGSNWHTYRHKVESALCNQSKDLELGLFLAEACTQIYQFTGLRDGLWAVRGLITNFKITELFPKAIDGNYGLQLAKLEAINSNLSDAVRQIPLTMRTGASTNYDLNYLAEATRPGGMITMAEFDAAASVGTEEQYDQLLESVAEARAELDALKSTVAESYGPDAPSFSTLRDTADAFKNAVRRILHKRRGSLPPPPPTLPPGGPHHEPRGVVGGSWEESEELVRKGDIGSALALMTRLASSEPNGRVRYHRKLMLADLCLQTNRKQLGTSILEELSQIVEDHKLESWEDANLVGGLWSRLVRCYRDKGAGTANESKESEFYLKLSRLDPWQALNCGEPERKKD